MDANYTFYVKFIETHVHAFLPLNISAVSSVNIVHGFGSWHEKISRDAEFGSWIISIIQFCSSIIIKVRNKTALFSLIIRNFQALALRFGSYHI